MLTAGISHEMEKGGLFCCCFGFDAALIWKYNKPAAKRRLGGWVSRGGGINAAETHLQDAVVRPSGIHDGGVGGEGPELQRQPHQLLVLIFHQVVLHVAAAAEGQRVAVWQGAKNVFKVREMKRIGTRRRK